MKSLSPATPGTLRRIAAVLAAAALLPAPCSLAAFIGSSKIDDNAGQRQIAIVTFSSLTRATKAISDVVSCIGERGGDATASAILSWLTMLPSLECADLAREASVVFLTPQSDLQLADQVAIIPLSPINGERLLRNSLEETYAKITGKTVVYCSEPKGSAVVPGLALIVTRNVAYVANGPESLRWIARNYKGEHPLDAGKLRDDAVISAFFDAALTANAMEMLLSGAATDEGSLTIRLLSSFRDLLKRLSSLHLSFSANLNACRLTASLAPEDSAAGFFSSGTPDGAPLDFIPRDAHCISDSFFRHFSVLLPDSFRNRFSCGGAFSFFSNLDILTGAFASRSSALEPFLTGESASAYFTSKASAISAKITVFKLNDPAGAAAALAAAFNAPIDPQAATMRPPRESNGHKIWGYTSHRTASLETSDDFAASVVILFTQLNCVELAVVGDELVVVSGPLGTIDKLLNQTAIPKRDERFGSLAKTLGALPGDETFLGCGELEPTQTFQRFTQNSEALNTLSRHLPSHGGSISWRISRKDRNAILDLSASASELFALSMLGKIDQQLIGRTILQAILGHAEGH